MSPDHVLSGPAAERVQPYSFDRPEAPPSPGPALAAIHIEQEVERRTRELTEQIRDEARRAGFDEGAASARGEMQSVIDALRQAVDQATQSTDDVLDDLARSALQAGMAIAEAVVGKALVEDPEAMVDPVRCAIHELDGDDELVLYLNPADRKAIGHITDSDDHDVKPADLSLLLNSVRVADDPSIPRGSCRVESATRIAIDGLEERLDDIRRAVQEW